MTSVPHPSERARRAADREDRLVALLQRVGNADQEAFAALYDAVVPTVYGLARRIVIDADLAADVAQEALLDVWRTAPRFAAERGSAIGWVCAITHRRAVDTVRSSQARREREHRAGSGWWDRDHDVVSDQVGEASAAADDRRRVRQCLDGLTELEREAITSAYYGGLSYREVAERLGAGLPAVKSRMRSGLRRLQECLGVER